MPSARRPRRGSGSTDRPRNPQIDFRDELELDDADEPLEAEPAAVPARPSRRAAAPRRGGSRGRAQRGAPRGRGRTAPADGEAARRRPRSDLLSRVLVAVPAAIVAIIFVNLGGLVFALFMILAGALCLHELYGMLHRWRPAPLVGFAALAAMVIAARFGSERDVLELAMAALPVAFLVVVARSDHTAATVSIAGTLLAVFWVGLAFAHAVLLRQLPHGSGVIIDVLIGTFLGDSAAYFGGRLFGRRHLAPRISPHKTVEGLFCGMLIAILSIFVAGLYQDWLTQGDALLLGVAVAVLGPIGDLFESLVKRDAGAKDSGGVFGAHGGALDRLDAVIFTIVAGYYVWLAVMP